MQRVQLSTSLIVIAILVVAWIGIYFGGWHMSDFLSSVPQYLIGAIFIVIFWGVGKNITDALGKKDQSLTDKVVPFNYVPAFHNLRVYYHRIKGVWDTPSSSQHRYLVDDLNRKAYPISEFPEWIIKPIEKHEILWVAFDTENLLKRSIKTQFTIIDSNPSPESIGLTISTGTLTAYDEFSDLLKKLSGQRLEHLQIGLLKRRHFLSFKKRTVIIDFSAKEVWLAPPSCYLLKDKKIIFSEDYDMHFWEKCKPWSKRVFGFTFIPNYYPESRLLSKGSVSSGASSVDTLKS